jgi:RHS repeat-associated protein
MTFAPDVPQVEGLKLTAESDSLGKESKDFSNLVATQTNQNSYKGNSSVALAKNKGMISSRVIKVNKGEKLTLSAFATFDKNETTLATVEDLAKRSTPAALLAGAAAALSVQDVNIGNESKSKSLNINFLAVVPFVKNLFAPKRNNKVAVPYQPEKPTSYVEIAVYKDSLLSEQLHSKQLSITENAEFSWENLQDSLVFENDGFAVVSLRNESEKEVLFDELNVRVYGTEKAVIIQENHYEPFGMTLKGLDYVLNEKQKNQFLYNGKELDESLDLQLYDYHARQVDPQTGRFNQIDPHAHKYSALSGYVYVANNPMKFIDPDGKDLVIASYKQMKEEMKKEGVDISRKDYRAFKKEVKNMLKTLDKTEIGKNILSDLKNSKHTHLIVGTAGGSMNNNADNYGFTNSEKKVGNGSITRLNFSQHSMTGIADENKSKAVMGGHELGHAWMKDNGVEEKRSNEKTEDAVAYNNAAKESRERGSSHIENMIRGELGVSMRETYTITLDAFKNGRYVSGGGGEKTFNVMRGTEADYRNKTFDIYKDFNITK